MENRKVISILTLLLIIQITTGISFPQNGQLDTTFGQGGIVTNAINVSGYINNAFSVAIQDDGKIVVAGEMINDNNDFVLVRYNPNGALDNTFGTNGIVVTQINTFESRITSIAIQSDGKIVAAGYSWIKGVSVPNFAIARYNPNGALDNTFGTNGIVTTQVGNSSNAATSVAIQNDGKIVAAGYSWNGSDMDFAVVRYNPNGALDNTFGANGIVTTQIGNSFDAASSVAIQSDGKIVVGGYYSNDTDDDFAVIRYNPNGALDNTFGTNGVVKTYFIGETEGETNRFFSVSIQMDGKIVAAGYSYNNNKPYFTVVRYNSDGALDNTFGGDGHVTTLIGNSGGLAYSIAIQNDGKIIVTGNSFNGSDTDFTLARYNTDGSLDNTFGTNGIVTTQIGNLGDSIRSVAIQSDGKIVAAGFSDNGSDNDFALARYNANGSLDNTFANFGVVTTSIGISRSRIWSETIQSDGKIVAAGESWNGSDNDFALTRHNTDGSLDNTFGTNGTVTTQIGNSFDVAYSVAIQNDGKIVAAGASNDGSNDNIALVRYNTNGFMDNTFGMGGIVTTPVGLSESEAYSVVIQSDGKIVVGAYSYNGSDNDFAIVRYNTDGSLDNTFGTDGIVITPIGNYDNYVISIAIQSDGKIVAAGDVWIDNSDFALVRYNPNGDLDENFGTNGIVTTPIGGSYDGVKSIAIQSDGKIVVAGHSDNGIDYDFAIARYNPNGALDNTFGAGGIITTQIGTSDDFAEAVAIQGNSKIIAAGYSDNGNDNDFAIVCYNPDGVLDSTFGTDGIVTTQIGNSDNRAFTVGIQDDGNIVVAGYAYDGGNYLVFALVRYLISPLSSVGITPFTSSIPIKFTLEQNYPNPFNPVTKIRYSIPQASLVSVKVYDVLGKEIETLAKEEKPAGTYELKWNAANLPSGVYFYRIQAENFIETKKMNLLK